MKSMPTTEEAKKEMMSLLKSMLPTNNEEAKKESSQQDSETESKGSLEKIFLEHQMSDIELIPGVTKKIITKGDDGSVPEKGQEVLVNYEGRLTNGTIFDSSYDREALKVVIGVGQVIKGWDVGIMSM